MKDTWKGKNGKNHKSEKYGNILIKVKIKIKRVKIGKISIKNQIIIKLNLK